MSQPRIMVFDSGVGGLSIAKEIRLQIPECRIIFASDNAGFPYGTKSESELCQRIDVILHRFLQEAAADIVVVACNTASTVALPQIREKFDIPIIGVVPAIKPAAMISNSKTVAVLATPATVDRPYTHALIEDFAADCDVILQGSSELVTLAEEKLRGRNITPAELAPIIEPFLSHPKAHLIDTVVLACTHFPLLQPELAKCYPQIVNWVDSGAAIAKRAQYLIEQLDLSSKYLTDQDPQDTALFSQACDSITALVPALADLGLMTIRYTK